MKTKIQWISFFTSLALCIFLSNSAWSKGKKVVSFGVSPHVLQLMQSEVNVHPHPKLSIGGGVSYFSFNIPSSFMPNLPATPTLSTQAFESKLRWHPFGGSFFIGSMLGRESFTVKQSLSTSIENPETTESIPVGIEGSLKLQSYYLGANLGWLAIFDSGFLLGFDVGWHYWFKKQTTITVNPTTELSTSLMSILEATGAYADLQSSTTDTVSNSVNKITKYGVPAISMLKIGWAF